MTENISVTPNLIKDYHIAALAQDVTATTYLDMQRSYTSEDILAVNILLN